MYWAQALQYFCFRWRSVSIYSLASFIPEPNPSRSALTFIQIASIRLICTSSDRFRRFGKFKELNCIEDAEHAWGARNDRGLWVGGRVNDKIQHPEIKAAFCKAINSSCCY
jgi:hypothetical protein